MEEDRTKLKQPGFPKGSFGYKMSKKVGELTQVVHMLFTRNHEREVELEELRDAYEQEITNVIQDARNRIEKLEYQLRESERRRRRETDEVAGNTTQMLREAQERMEIMKNDIIEEKRESTQLRDLLTQAHKDLERLKQGSTGVSGDLLKKNKMLEEKEKELHRLWQIHNDVEAKLKANIKYADEMKKQSELSQDELHKTKLLVEKHSKISEEANRNSETLQKRVNLLEEKTKLLKRELNKKLRDFNKEEMSSGRKSRPQTKEGGDNSADRGKKLWKEEIDRLKRENEWLRNELRNREGNFNRVFASFQPVFVGVGRTHQDILQERDMMMVTPTSSFTPPINSNRNSLVATPIHRSGRNNKGRTPNLTGLEPRVQTMVPSPTPFRPATRGGSGFRDNQADEQNNLNNFRLIYTK